MKSHEKPPFPEKVLILQMKTKAPTASGASPVHGDMSGAERRTDARADTLTDNNNNKYRRKKI